MNSTSFKLEIRKVKSEESRKKKLNNKDIRSF